MEHSTTYLIGEPYHVCPASLVTPDVYGMLRAHGHFADGRMWYPGAPSEQPAKYLRAMEIIGASLSAIRRKERELKKQQG